MMADLSEEIEFFESGDNLGPVKATVQATGRLGFSLGASKLMNLDESKLFKIGRLKAGLGGETTMGDLLLIPAEAEDEQTFKVCKAGEYFFLKTKRIMGQLGIDYKNESVIYDIDEMKRKDGTVYYRLCRKKKRPNTT